MSYLPFLAKNGHRGCFQGWTVGQYHGQASTTAGRERQRDAPGVKEPCIKSERGTGEMQRVGGRGGTSTPQSDGQWQIGQCILLPLPPLSLRCTCTHDPGSHADASKRWLLRALPFPSRGRHIECSIGGQHTINNRILVRPGCLQDIPYGCAFCAYLP